MWLNTLDEGSESFSRGLPFWFQKGHHLYLFTVVINVLSVSKSFMDSWAMGSTLDDMIMAFATRRLSAFCCSGLIVWDAAQSRQEWFSMSRLSLPLAGKGFRLLPLILSHILGFLNKTPDKNKKERKQRGHPGQKQTVRIQTSLWGRYTPS